jgi:hypothetical protein
MWRIVVDLIVIFVLVGGDIALRAVEQRSVDVSRFTGEYWFIIWTAAMTLAALFRAIVGAVAIKEKSPLYGLIEWFSIAVLSNVLIVLLDVRWHPEYSLKTVMAFGLFPVVLPSVIASTIVYFVVSRAMAK